MAWHHSFIADVLVATASGGVTLCIYALRRRFVPGALLLALFTAAAAEWALANAAELYLVRAADKVTAAKLEYIGVVNLPVLLLLFSLSFSGRGELITPRRAAALWIVPLTVLVFVFTNQRHGLVWPHVTWASTGSGRALVYAHGPVAWLNVGYAYTLMLAGSLLLLRTALGFATLHRRQALTVLAAVLIPWAANAAYLAHLARFTPVDFSPAAMIISAGLMAWSVFHFHLLSATPVTYETLLATMKDGVVVADREGRVVELNVAGQRLLRLAGRGVGRSLEEAMAAWPGLAEHCLSGEAHHSQAILDDEEGSRWLDVQVSPLKDRRGDGCARLIVLHDATESHSAEELVRQRDVLLETVSHSAAMLLRDGNWRSTVPLILKQLGEATKASRAYVFRHVAQDEAETVTTQMSEWCARGVRPQAGNPRLRDLPLRAAGLGRWIDVLGANGVIAAATSQLPPTEQLFLQRLGTVSVLVMPIFVEGRWWGFMGFDDCVQMRRWTEVETEALRLAASILGGAVQRDASAAALQETAARAQRTVEETVQALGSLVETRDPHTAGHQRRVAELSAALAAELGLPKGRQETLRLAACLHDVGKVGVPSRLLTQPRQLTEAETRLVERHPQLGAAVLSGIEFDGPVAQIVRQHHERLDGSGYPEGLRGEEILLEARILAVADVAEAMASERAHRPAFALQDVIKELRRGAGVVYDARACEACERLVASGRFSFDKHRGLHARATLAKAARV